MSNSYDITWYDVDKMIEYISNNIISSNFKPNFVAPIPKGGWTVASLLAQRLGIKNSVSLAQEKIDNIRNTYIAGFPNLKSARILVIEDSIETGNSLFDAEKTLVELGAYVKTVSLYISPNYNGKNPDFFFNKGVIPEFPWEINYNK